MVETDPFQVFLQHGTCWQHDQKLLCKLLCLSKAVRAILRRKYPGRATVKFSGHTSERTGQFTPWLAKHGLLLESLQLDINLCGGTWHETEAAVAAALQQAAAGAPYDMLQLKEYSSNPACDGAVLTYLPAFYLTRLQLGPRAAFSSSFALEQLTRLRSLSLYGDSADLLMCAMPAMTSLSHLALHYMASGTVPKLQKLPSQLLLLHLSLGMIRKSETISNLQLGHLTALTELSSEGNPLIVQKGDVLPPNLAILQVRDVKVAGPLLLLKHLKLLDMHLSTTQARELQAIGSNLQQLHEVRLGYSDICDWAVKSAAPGWSALPLKRLEFRGCDGRCEQVVLEQLPKLQQLTCLEVYGGLGCCRFAGVLDASPHELAGLLRQMTALQELGLRGIRLQPEPEEGAPHCSPSDVDGNACSPSSSTSSLSSTSSASSADGAMELMQAIASLPQLQQLAFCGIYSKDAAESQLSVDPAAASQLATATQLTGLFLVDCGLGDDAVNTLAGSLTGLQVLKLDSNPLVTPEVLPGDIASQLSSLKELCVLRTGIRLRARSFKQRLESLHPGLHVKSCAR